LDRKERPCWGAVIERGIVRSSSSIAPGRYSYTIDSVDRPGVTATDIPQVQTYAARIPDGGLALFFMFDDGTGGVIG